MSHTSPSPSRPLDQDAGIPYDSSSVPASAHLPAARLGDFSTIFDLCFASDKDVNTNTNTTTSTITTTTTTTTTTTATATATISDTAIAPGSPRKTTSTLPLRAYSPGATSTGVARDAPYKGGLLNGLDFSTIVSPSGSVSSTPQLQDTVSDGDDDDDDDDDNDDDSDSDSDRDSDSDSDRDSDSDDADIDPVRLSRSGLFEPPDIGRKTDAQWPYGAGVEIASASTSPATAMAASSARTAGRSAVVPSPSFANALSGIGMDTIALLSRPAYPGQPSPVPISASPSRQSPRRTKQASIPHHRKTVPEKLDLIRSQLCQEIKLDNQMKRTMAAATKPIHVIVDMSNIFIGFMDKAKTHYKLAGRSCYVPFSFQALTEILVRGRSHDLLAAAGSIKEANSRKPDYMIEAQELGYRVSILERIKKQDSDTSTPHAAYGSSFREQAVDEVLHLQICVSILDYEPATLVLATGDAKEAEFSDGFLSNVKRALKKGWCVELYSWKSNISRDWLNLKREQTVPNQFRIIELDRYLDFLIGPNPAF